MKKILLALAACFSLSGCVDDPPPVRSPVYNVGTIEYCDYYGCRYVTSSYYYDSSGVLFYWDVNLGCWIGPRGYWRGGVFYSGFHPRYNRFYGRVYVGRSGGFRGGRGHR